MGKKMKFSKTVHKSLKLKTDVKLSLILIKLEKLVNNVTMNVINGTLRK